MSTKAHDPDRQHYRTEYLAGQLNAIIIAIGMVARLTGIRSELSDELKRFQSVTEKNLEASPSTDYHTGSLHAARRILKEMY